MGQCTFGFLEGEEQENQPHHHQHTVMMRSVFAACARSGEVYVASCLSQMVQHTFVLSEREDLCHLPVCHHWLVVMYVFAHIVHPKANEICALLCTSQTVRCTSGSLVGNQGKYVVCPQWVVERYKIVYADVVILKMTCVVACRYQMGLCMFYSWLSQSGHEPDQKRLLIRYQPAAG